MPGSIPLATSTVNAELTQYLQDSWKAIIDADVDGPNSEPAQDRQRRSRCSGSASLTKRLARTVFFGAAADRSAGAQGAGDASGSSSAPRCPATSRATSTPRLTQLGDRATYFYSGSGKYWYDLQANITRRAKDQAERLHVEDVWAEIVRRLATRPSAAVTSPGCTSAPRTPATSPTPTRCGWSSCTPRSPTSKGDQDVQRHAVRPAARPNTAAPRTGRTATCWSSSPPT